MAATGAGIGSCAAIGDVGASGHAIAAARAGSATWSLARDGLSSGAGVAVIAVVLFCCFVACWPTMLVAPLLTTVSILMCGSCASGVPGVIDTGAPPVAIAGFSNGMGVVGLTRDVAALGFSNGVGVIGFAWDVALSGFSNGMGVVDVTGDVVCAAGC
jgi:hypothetical protein